MFLPPRCPLCGVIGAAPCASCASALVPAPRLPPVPGCTSVAACWRYDGAARALVLAFKFRNRRDTRPACAAALAALVAPHEVDLVTWAPTTAARVRARGYDQAEVLARSVARQLRRPVHRTVRREGHRTQTGHGAAERRSGAVFSLDRRAAARVRGARVLVVDDILTTGATFAHAASVLRDAGAAAVHVRALAATPPPGFGTSVRGMGGAQVAS
jgi:ComF family protein